MPEMENLYLLRGGVSLSCAATVAVPVIGVLILEWEEVLLIKAQERDLK